MPRKPRDPFAYTVELDGSVGLSQRFRGVCYHIGHYRAAPDGKVIYSPTYEEPEDFSFWHVQSSVEDAVRDLVQAKIVCDDGHEVARLRSLSDACGLIPAFAGRANEALLSAARLSVMRAVANMLLIAPYEDVVRAVGDALASEVIGS